MADPDHIMSLIAAIYGSMTLAEFCRLEYEVGTGQRPLPRQPSNPNDPAYEAHTIAYQAAMRLYPGQIHPSFPVIHGPFISGETLTELSRLIRLPPTRFETDDARETLIHAVAAFIRLPTREVS